MNKLNEYLESLDKKNLFMLYASVVIVFIIIAFMIEEYYFESKINNLNAQKIKLIKKISKTKKNEKILIKLKKNYLRDKSLLASLKEDFIYLNSVISSSNKLYIDKRKYLKILKNYLQKGANLNASFELNETKNIEKYKIYINGSFLSQNYFEFTNFLKIIESPNAVITINNINLFEKKSKIFYDINVSIWSIK